MRYVLSLAFLIGLLACPTAALAQPMASGVSLIPNCGGAGAATLFATLAGLIGLRAMSRR